jgi:hypothetical protein
MQSLGPITDPLHVATKGYVDDANAAQDTAIDDATALADTALTSVGALNTAFVDVYAWSSPSSSLYDPILKAQVFS